MIVVFQTPLIQKADASLASVPLMSTLSIKTVAMVFLEFMRYMSASSKPFSSYPWGVLVRANGKRGGGVD